MTPYDIIIFSQGMRSKNHSRIVQMMIKEVTIWIFKASLLKIAYINNFSEQNLYGCSFCIDEYIYIYIYIFGVDHVKIMKGLRVCNQ